MDEPLRRRAGGFELRLVPDRAEEILAEVVSAPSSGCRFRPARST